MTKNSTRLVLAAKREADKGWAKAFLNDEVRNWRLEKLQNGTFKLRGEYDADIITPLFRTLDEAGNAVRILLPEDSHATVNRFDTSTIAALEISGLTEKDLAAFGQEVNFRAAKGRGAA